MSLVKRLETIFGIGEGCHAAHINLILFGPPGSGKGTQAKLLEEEFGLIQVSTGDLFRHELGNNTPLGEQAKEYMDRGELVPDMITIQMLQKKIEQYPESKGFIYDGFPRTRPQAKALDEMLDSKGESVNMLIALHVDDDEIVERLLERGKTSGRSDDASEEIIRNRIEVYKAETSPVYEYYDQKGLATTVRGHGTIEEISKTLSQVISQLSE